MKTLFLLRHAKSSWKHPELSDFERPLNKRGRSAAPLMGRLLAKRGVLPDLIISSPAVRACSTARIVAAEIGYEHEKIVYDEELYLADPETLLRIVLSADERLDSLMLVGHNPGLTEFANSLAGEEIENVPTAGLLQIEFQVSSWAEIQHAAGRLVHFDRPPKGGS